MITNYSMLSVMLMRGDEYELFNKTKKWYAAHPDSVFHLVLDELHLYRGTSGTEVAYLLRLFLDAIGIPPTKEGKPNPQLRILASSASLGGEKDTQDFLSQFFGIYDSTNKDRKLFEIVGSNGTDYPIHVPTEEENQRLDYSLFANFAEQYDDGGYKCAI